MSMRKSERGGSSISSIFWLLVLAGAIYAGFNVIPAFFSHYELQDKMVELCRLPRYQNPDDRILELLMKKVQEERLHYYIKAQNFQITSSESNRRIKVEYDRDLKILPGFTMKHHFASEADQPLAF